MTNEQHLKKLGEELEAWNLRNKQYPKISLNLKMIGSLPLNNLRVKVTVIAQYTSKIFRALSSLKDLKLSCIYNAHSLTDFYHMRYYRHALLQNILNNSRKQKCRYIPLATASVLSRVL